MRKLLAVIGLLAGLIGSASAQPGPVPALPDTQRMTSYSLSASLCNCAVGFALYGDGIDADNWLKVTVNGTAYLSTDPAFGWFLSSTSGPIGSIALPITNAILTFTNPQTGQVQITGARRPRRLSQFPENRGVSARDLNVALTDIVAQNRESWDRGSGSGGGGGGGGAVSSVSNSNGTLTFAPTTGAVIGSLNTAHANTWTAVQTFSSGVVFSGLGSGGQVSCLGLNASNQVVFSAGACGTGGGGGSIVLGTTPVTGSPSPIVGDCLVIASGPVVGQTTCGGGGGGGLDISRAQIPTTNTGGASFVANGYAAKGDYGSGAPYTCTGQGSSSIGAIQDSVGTWCAFDLQRVLGMGGFRPQWFGAVGSGGPDDTVAFQAAIDASFRTNSGQVYCNGLFPISWPLFFDPPANLRGQDRWRFGGYYLPANDITNYQVGTTLTQSGVSYVNKGGGFGLTAYGQPPSSPNNTRMGLNLGYKIVNATTAVTYNPTHTTAGNDFLAILPLKGVSAIGTPLYLTSSGQSGGPVSYSPNGSGDQTNQTAVINSTIVVFVLSLNGVPITSVTDSAGHTYTQQVNFNLIHIFTSINIGTPLPAGGTITVNGDDTAMIAVSVTNANGGVDTPAIRTGSFSSTTSPSLASGTLAQAVEIVFGAFGENIATNQTAYSGFAESTGFTTTTPSVWVNAAWSSLTTYAQGDIVIYQGIPWISLKNGNLNNVPTADLINGPLVNWRPITQTPTVFSQNSTLYGPPALPQAKQSSGLTCIIWAQYNNSAALIMPTGNGNTLDSVYVKGQDTDLGCGQPSSGIGIAVIGTNGGANRTSFRNVGVTGFYMDFGIGLVNIQNPFGGGGTLGAENRIDNSNIDEGCYGVYYASTQAFVNSITNSTIRAIHSVVSNSTLGVHLYNVNMAYEGLTAPRNKFAMAVSGGAATTDSAGILFNATLTLAGDPNMIVACTDPNVPVHFGHFGQNVSSTWRLNFCDANVYNAWSLRTADYGLIPVLLTAFNPGTGVATFRVLDEWLQNWGGVAGPIVTGALLSEIGAQTSIWAVEMTQKFVGAGIDAEQIHLEDDLLPFQLVDSMTAFGQPRPVILKNVYFNADPSKGDYTPGDPASEAAFFAQQEFPFIHQAGGVGSGNITLDNVCCTLNNVGDNVMVDMASSQGGPNNAQIFVKGGTFGNLNFRYPASRATVGNFTGYGDNGSAAFGTGRYEMTPWQGFAMNSLTAGSFVGDNDQGDRTVSWNSGPYWGVRPSPWTAPCVTASQWVTLQGTLPAITNASFQYFVPYPLLWSGQEYKVCDWKWLAPVAFNVAVSYSYGQLVTSGGTTYFSLQDANLGNTPPSPARWLPWHAGFLSAHGVGFSYGQDLTTTNMPGLTWSLKNNSPFVNITTSVHVGTLFPGLQVGLAGTQGGCTGQENFIIREVHFNLKYISIFNADKDVAGNMVPAFSPGSPFVCSNNVIKQAPYVFQTIN